MTDKNVNKVDKGLEMTPERCEAFLKNTPKLMYFLAFLAIALTIFTKNAVYLFDSVVLIVIGVCFAKFKSPLLAITFAFCMLADFLATLLNFASSAGWLTGALSWLKGFAGSGGKNIFMAFLFFALSINATRAAFCYQKFNRLKTNYVNFLIKTAVGIAYSTVASFVFIIAYSLFLPFRVKQNESLIGLVLALIILICFILAYFGMFFKGGKFPITEKLPEPVEPADTLETTIEEEITQKPEEGNN